MLGVIPARGGSRGVPGKNLAPGIFAPSAITRVPRCSAVTAPKSHSRDQKASGSSTDQRSTSSKRVKPSGAMKRARLEAAMRSGVGVHKGRSVM